MYAEECNCFNAISSIGIHRYCCNELVCEYVLCILSIYLSIYLCIYVSMYLCMYVSYVSYVCVNPFQGQY